VLFAIAVIAACAAVFLVKRGSFAKGPTTATRVITDEHCCANIQVSLNVTRTELIVFNAGPGDALAIEIRISPGPHLGQELSEHNTASIQLLNARESHRLLVEGVDELLEPIVVTAEWLEPCGTRIRTENTIAGLLPADV